MMLLLKLCMFFHLFSFLFQLNEDTVTCLETYLLILHYMLRFIDLFGVLRAMFYFD